MPGLYKLLGVQVIDPEITRFFKKVVAQMITQREEGGARRHDFMDLLVELKNKGQLRNNDGNSVGGAEDVQSEEIGKKH